VEGDISRVDMVNQILSDDPLKKHVIKDSAVSFSKKVEDMVWALDMTYLDAVLSLMEQSGYEAENMPKLLTAEIKSKLEIEAENLSLIKKTTNRLDI